MQYLIDFRNFRRTFFRVSVNLSFTRENAGQRPKEVGFSCAAERLISQINYNEIGQVMTKNLHSLDSVNFLQSINYTYNERGWLLQSTAPLFEEQLQYGIGVLGSVPQFNGNIDFASWGTGANPDSASFIYNYDQLSRLTSGVSSDGN